MKRCTKCGETKPATAFSPLATTKTGLHPWCKPCRSAHVGGKIAAARAAARAKWLDIARKAEAAALALALLLAAPAQAHDFYSDLRAPDTGLGCCGGHDCAPREACRTADIPDGLIVDGVCYPIDPAKVLPISAPDGADHACLVKGDKAPRCFILSDRV